MYMLWQRRRRARYDAEYYMPLTETASEQKADPDFRVVGVKGDLQLEDVPTLVRETSCLPCSLCLTAPPTPPHRRWRR